jgi:hypothetical protein
MLFILTTHIRRLASEEAHGSGDLYGDDVYGGDQWDFVDVGRQDRTLKWD